MTQSDPTDHALAAIASILDHASEKPESKAEQEKAEHEPESSEPSELEAEAELTPEPQPEAAAPVAAPQIDIENYSRLGPGPLDAIRFRWTARRDEAGQYFVDETIGPSSRPLVLGPMRSDEVVAFIDNREREARRRFDALKSEMTLGKRTPDYDSGDDDGES